MTVEGYEVMMRMMRLRFEIVDDDKENGLRGSFVMG
jgi:hypothetical protein